MSSPVPPIGLVGPVAVIIPRFPSVTGTALLREVDELERQGLPIHLVALAREDPSLVPEEAEGWIDRVIFLRLIGWRVLVENARVIMRHPARWLGTLLRLTWDARGDIRHAAAVLGHYLAAVELGQRLRALGACHVHAHDAELPALVAQVAAHVHRSTDLPSSVTVHGQDIATSHAGLGSRLADSSFLRCTSQHAALALKGALGSALHGVPVVMIRRGMTVGPVPRAPALGRPGVERALRVTCVARLEPSKGVANLIEAMRLLARGAGGLPRLVVECALIGEGSERANLERLARQADLENHVKFRGALSQRDVAQALRAADVFVLPSSGDERGRIEGLPAALVEALASGTPAIATRMGGIPELIVSEETGLLVEPEDVHALAMALARIANDPEGAMRRAERGVEHVRAAFMASNMAARLVSEFERAGARLEVGSGSEAMKSLDIADIASESAALIAPGCARVGVVSIRRSADGLAVELRVPVAQELGATRVLARRRAEGASGSPIPETRALAALAAAMASSDGEDARPHLPSVVGSLAARRLEIISLVDGRPLTALVRRGRWLRGDPDLAVSMAGEWLGRFERIPLPAGDTPAHDREAVAARVLHEAHEDALRCVQLGLAKSLVDRALQMCRRELREGLPPATCWSHGRFVPGHLVVSGLDHLFNGIERHVPQAASGRVTGIELGGLQPGVPGEDAAAFLECLALIVPGLASLGLLRERRHELERAFLGGRDGVAPTAPTPALRAAKLLAVAARWSGLMSGPHDRAARPRQWFLRLRLSARILELTT